jgi:hypothetical protein
MQQMHTESVALDVSCSTAAVSNSTAYSNSIAPAVALAIHIMCYKQVVADALVVLSAISMYTVL